MGWLLDFLFLAKVVVDLAGSTWAFILWQNAFDV